MSAAAPPITITVASHDGWSAFRFVHEALRGQAEAHHAEVLYLDGSDQPWPDAAETGPTVRFVRMAGADITELRMRGYREARAPIVAMTEDHCQPAPDWIEAILRAHAEHPGAAAIGGVSINGSPHRLMDWASFYAGHAPYLAPLPPDPQRYVSGVNLSFKRDLLLPVLGTDERAIETLITQELRARGHELVGDDRVAVTHFQSRGFFRTALLHFYAGQNFEGTRQLEGADDAWRRVVRSAVLPWPRVARRVLTVLGRGEPAARIAKVTPSMVVVATAQAAGEIVGALRGPGRSAGKLH